MKCLLKSFLIFLIALVFIFNDSLCQINAEKLGVPSVATSNLSEWYEPIITEAKPVKITDYPIPRIETVARKISKMHLSVSIKFDDKVYTYIKYLLTEGREDFEVALGLLDFYSKKIDTELIKQAIPNEFKYLPIALTGLHNEFKSDQGAGVWKLNYIMARRYGLEVSEYHDARKDIALSSKLTATLLNKYYTKYKSWKLAMSAIVGSPALVNRAIQRSNGEEEYDKILHHFPDEIQQIVPAFLAIAYLAENYSQHGLNPVTIALMPDATELKKEIALTDVSRLLNINEHRLRMINPTIRSSIAPASTNKQKFYLPPGYGTLFSQIEDSLYSLAKIKLTPIRVAPKKPVIPVGSKEIFHTVVSGDNLSIIAERYNVRVSQLKSWNGIYSDLINVGQKIMVYISKSNTSYVQSQNLHTKNVNLSSKEKATLVLYTVQAGDTLWGIAHRYPGNSIEEIQKINGINTNIQPGQIVKIKKTLTH